MAFEIRLRPLAGGHSRPRTAGGWEMGRAQEAEALKQHFLGWQCRIRQLALRQHGGRPTPGMRPGVRIGGAPAGEITTLLVKNDSAPYITLFQHLYRQTHDPAERHESAAHFFAAAYYQRPQEFSGQITALFGPDSNLANRLREAGRCGLEFRQFSQSYLAPCTVDELKPDEPAFEFTFAHNRLFNPSLPLGVRVLGFTPRWQEVRADPAIE